MTSAPKASDRLAVIDRGSYLAVLRLDRLDDPTPMRLEGTGLEIWRLVDGRRTAQQIADVLAERYDLAAHELRQQIDTFLDRLAEAGLITSPPGHEAADAP